MSSAFSYEQAFSRTLGWITPWEQQQLRHRRIAIAGCGGVGGVHLLTLARLGIGSFHLADLDVFEPVNFNRQAGALLSTLGQPKVDVIANMGLDINPELQIRRFPQGVHAHNVDEFLAGVDLYMDSLDFFAFEARSAVFAACRRLGIPAITVAPVGMSACLVNFLPDSMSFEDYFGLDGQNPDVQALRLVLGVAPGLGHVKYLVAPEFVDFAQRKVASTPMSVQLCAGVAGVEALKILLHRGKTLTAPRTQCFDAYLNRRSTTHRPLGYRNPVSRAQLALVQAMLARRVTAQAATQSQADPEPSTAGSTLLQILELARWAPSGDNGQPWRFKLLGEREVEVHFTGQGAGDLYDAGGRGSLLSLGCLTECLRLAASQYQWRMRWTYQPHGEQASGGVMRVIFEPDPSIAKDPLVDFVRWRSVDRRPYRGQNLSEAQRHTLQVAVGTEFHIGWLQTWQQRWQASRLNAATTQLRSSIPESVDVLMRAITWSSDHSNDRLPLSSLGLSRPTQALVRWMLATPQRAHTFTRLPGATLGAQLETEIIPGLRCAAHFLLERRPSRAPQDADTAAIHNGIALQRFWLCASQLGLVLQPSYVNLSFHYYASRNEVFSTVASALPSAKAVSQRFQALCLQAKVAPDQVVYMGRIGTPQLQPQSGRSLRKPLSELLF